MMLLQTIGYRRRSNGSSRPTNVAIHTMLVKCQDRHGPTFANGLAAKLDSMADITVCSAAEEDYTQSLCWYAERSIEAAQDFDAEFDRALLQITADPERFPLCDDRHRYFLMQRFPFRIIYRIVGSDYRCHCRRPRISLAQLLGRSVASKLLVKKRFIDECLTCVVIVKGGVLVIMLVHIAPDRMPAVG